MLSGPSPSLESHQETSHEVQACLGSASLRGGGRFRSVFFGASGFRV